MLDRKYYFDSKNDTVEEYLRRAACWFDSYYNGMPLPDGSFIKDVLNTAEQRELINVVGEVFYRYCVRVANTIVQNIYIKPDFREDFYQYLALQAWTSLYKFNNSRVKECGTEFAFYTFIKHRVYNSLRLIESDITGVKRDALIQLNAINKAKNLSAAELIVSPDDIGIEQIIETLPRVSGISLSYKQVDDLMKISAPLYIEDLDEDILVSEDIPEVFIPNRSVQNKLYVWYSRLSVPQQFIFLQHNEFVSNEYIELTVNELCLLVPFIEICKADKVANKFVLNGMVEIKRKKVNGIRVDAGTLYEDVSYVKKAYINSTRISTRKSLFDFIMLHKLTKEDLTDNMTDFFMRMWRIMEDRYGF